MICPFNADLVTIAMKEKRLTLKKLGEIVGFHWRTIQEMLRRGTGKDTSIKKVADALDIPLEEIYKNPKPKTKNVDKNELLMVALVEELANICAEPDIEMSPKTILRIMNVVEKVGFGELINPALVNAGRKQMRELKTK